MCTGKSVKEMLQRYARFTSLILFVYLAFTRIRPDDRWEGTNGGAAMISMRYALSHTTSCLADADRSGGLLLRCAGSLVDNVMDPATSFSEEPNESAFSRAHGTELSCFDWLDLPGQELELKRFGIAMAAMTGHSDDAYANNGGPYPAPDPYSFDRLISLGFEWTSLAAGSKVVDVGGGVGNLTMALAKEHKHLQFIVQDRPGTAKEGEAVCGHNQTQFLV